MKNAIRAAVVCGSVLLIVANVALAQSTTKQALPAIQICIADAGGAVTTPRKGACPRGTLAELAQHADAQQIYGELAGLRAGLSDVEKELSDVGAQLEDHANDLAEVETSLDRAMDMFTIFINLKHPVQLEFSNEIIGEKGTYTTDLLVRDGLPGSPVKYRANPSSSYHTVGSVAPDGTFSTTLRGFCGDPLEIIVISLSGAEVAETHSPPC